MMKMSLRAFLAGILMIAGISTAAQTAWLTASAIPSSVEISTAHTSTGAETTPILAVYMGSTMFAAPYNTDKAKAWLEMIKAAIQSDKKININYDADFWPGFYVCEDYSSSGACLNPWLHSPYRIIRVSFQP